MMRQTKLADKSPLKYESRCLTEDKLNQVRNNLMQKDWVGLLNGTTNTNFDKFSQIISDEPEKVAPKRVINISAKRKYIEPWMTKGLEKASNKKLKLYKITLKPDHTEEDVTKYKMHRNIYITLKRSAKTTYYQEKCKSYKQITKKLWGLINETIRKTKHCGSIIPFITVNGTKLHKAKEIANSFGEFYSTLGAELAGKILPDTTSIDDYISRIPNQLSSLALNGTTVQEIEHIINQLPNKSSHGYDDISNTMLKSLCKAISFPLCKIFNDSILEGIFPTSMKQSEVIPLYKGKEMDERINYRPISLLITISKVLEKLIYKRLYSFLNVNGTLFSSQYGLRKNHSCEHAILELTGHILQAKNNGEQNACVFLDLSKAFDTLDHHILLSKLEKYGIGGTPLKWFKSYLDGRSLVAKIQTSSNIITYSEKFDISFGTAQGSCLGPLLFLIFIHDVHYLDLYSKLILFADDTTLFNPSFAFYIYICNFYISTRRFI